MKTKHLPLFGSAVTCVIAMVVLAGKAEAQSAKAFFKDGPGMNRVDQYPGKPGDGWATAWAVRKVKTVDMLSTVEGAPANPHLNIWMSVLDGAADYNNGAVVRLYDQADKDHTIRFKIKVEKTAGLPSSADFVGAFGGESPASNFNPKSTWVVRTIGKTPEQWRWGAYDGLADGGSYDGSLMKEIGGLGQGMKVAIGRTYAFTITNHPQKGTYDVLVSDGANSVETQNLKYRTTEVDWATPQAGLAFQAQGREVGNLLVFSVSEVEIAPAP
ncbi:hypothetical protein DB345_09830 [Spartobacteria bacterium LR76]|nr:hypothetical protein DB345_09830 [Spartobacteria bacterium LR76]